MRLMQTDAVWHHGQTLAAGQVAEFKVWSELIRQSTGGLHIFLPLRDRGIDGVVTGSRTVSTHPCRSKPARS